MLDMGTKLQDETVMLDVTWLSTTTILACGYDCTVLQWTTSTAWSLVSVDRARLVKDFPLCYKVTELTDLSANFGTPQHKFELQF